MVLISYEAIYCYLVAFNYISVACVKNSNCVWHILGQDDKVVMSASLVGGETEALDRLKKLAAECQAQPYKGSNDNTKDNIYGANFSCKISPFLAEGCLSPRFLLEEMKKTATRYVLHDLSANNDYRKCFL